MNSASSMAALNLGVIVAFAGLMTVVAMRVFQHATVK